MSKKKGHDRRGQAELRTGATPYAQTLMQAERLMAARRWSEAKGLLVPLAGRFPTSEDVLRALAYTYYQLHEPGRYALTAAQAAAVAPDDADLALASADAYIDVGKLVLAVRGQRAYLDRWPQHPAAAQTRARLAVLEPEVIAMLADYGITGKDALATMALHEQALLLVENSQGSADFARARAMSEQVLRVYPAFVAALNNISTAYALEGQLAEALATTQRVLASDPANVHALSNCVRYLCQLGRRDEAVPLVETLRTGRFDQPDAWVKQLEGLSFFGDDAGINAIFVKARRGGKAKADDAHPLGLHLAATAAARTGNAKRARQLWQEALQADPAMTLASTNLANLDLPPKERHAAWPFTLPYWLPPTTLHAIMQMVQMLARQTRGTMQTEALKGLLKKHPELTVLIPALLERGDLMSSDLALHIATTLQTPAMLAAVRDFALSQNGSQSLRMRAAQVASEAGMLPRGAGGTVRLWIDEEWRDILLFNFQVDDEPGGGQHGSVVEELIGAAIEAMHAKDAARAETLLRQAEALEPDAPDIQNNLAAAFEMQGRTEEAEALTIRLFAAHPDYLFGRVTMAHIAIREQRLQEAQDLLDPLFSRTRFHYQEFALLCSAQLSLYLQQQNYAAIQSWVQLWESLDPENPQLEQWQRIASMSTIFVGIQRIQARQGRRRKQP